MPARINNPRAADQLRREYSVMGDRLNMHVDDIVVPVAVVSDLTAGSSGVPLVRRAYGTFYQIAVAGEYTVIRLETPPGVIAVVSRLLVSATAASWLKVHFGSTIPAPANLSGVQMMDGRLRRDGIDPAVRVAYGTQVAALATPYLHVQANTAAATGHSTPLEWIFGREDAYDFIEIQSDAVNQKLAGTVEWDEIFTGQ